MAADLYIHVLTSDFTEEDYKLFHCNCIGSTYFNLSRYEEQDRKQVYDKAARTPQVHVGEVSWLKAALFKDGETYIPSAVEAISDIIGEEFPIIDDNLIDKISKALDLTNTTTYQMNSKKDILKFLRKYKGYKAIVISW